MITERRQKREPLDTAYLFGYPIHLVDSQTGLAHLQKLIDIEEARQGRRNAHVVTLNPEMIMQGEQDPELGEILKRADLIIPDGAGLVWALKTKGYRHVKRLPGIELSEALLQLANQKGYRVALIGAKVDVLMQAIDSLHRRLPDLQIVYFHHGFFNTTEEEQAIVDACAATKPNILLVALGVPRQEKWIARNRDKFQGTAFIGVGGSLDVWSGQTQRAPAWMRAMNLEWLYRITSEPWRIQRISKTLPLFVVKVLESLFSDRR